jgi:hypothetical protein
VERQLLNGSMSYFRDADYTPSVARHNTAAKPNSRAGGRTAQVVARGRRLGDIVRWRR